MIVVFDQALVNFPTKLNSPAPPPPSTCSWLGSSSSAKLQSAIEPWPRMKLIRDVGMMISYPCVIPNASSYGCPCVLCCSRAVYARPVLLLDHLFAPCYVHMSALSLHLWNQDAFWENLRINWKNVEPLLASGLSAAE